MNPITPIKSLGGWHKGLKPDYRRRLALASRPKRWSLAIRRLSAGKELLRISKMTTDKGTKAAALSDAKYFLSKVVKPSVIKSSRRQEKAIKKNMRQRAIWRH